LGAAGFDIAIHTRELDHDAASLTDALEAMGRRAAPVLADLAHEAETGALIAQATERLGALTLLVNNASVFHDDRIETATRQSWDAHMDVNLRAPVVLAQAFAASLDPDLADGQALILNIIDQRVLKPNPQFFSYSLSKGALWTATRTMAQALAPRIRVNAIGPGPTLASIHQDEATFAAEGEAVPLGRGSHVADICAAALYLVDARVVTGQMIAVDGGQHLAWRTPDIVDT
jgi:NAD(P)-dependent dehydrogenase (short-subunit alcohol dehydrogenase family)